MVTKKSTSYITLEHKRIASPIYFLEKVMNRLKDFERLPDVDRFDDAGRYILNYLPPKYATQSVEVSKEEFNAIPIETTLQLDGGAVISICRKSYGFGLYHLELEFTHTLAQMKKSDDCPVRPYPPVFKPVQYCKKNHLEYYKATQRYLLEEQKMKQKIEDFLMFLVIWVITGIMCYMIGAIQASDKDGKEAVKRGYAEWYIEEGTGNKKWRWND